MKKKLTFFALAIAFALLILGAFLLLKPMNESNATNNLAAPSPQEQEQPEAALAPDFTVYDADGNAVKLSDFRGKPTIVNFWASWCGPCKSEMPDFEAAYAEYGSKINFLMVNLTDGMQETKESAEAFLAKTEYSFPVYYDTQQNAAMTYGIYSIPTTYFFDAEGYGVTYARGALDLATLVQGVEMILPKEESK